MRERKRVLVFARHPGGGIRTYFRYVYGQQCMNDLELTFVTPRSPAMDSILARLSNARVHVTSKDTSIRLLMALIRILCFRRFDLIHSHGFTAGILAALPAKIFRVPHIITTHDVFMEGQFTGRKGKVKKWLIGRFLGLANTINPVGTDARDNLIQTYPFLDKRGRVVAIRNGIDSGAFLVDECRDLKAEGGVDSHAILLGFFGRFMAQKGFGLLVDAVEQWNQNQENKPLHVACFGWGGFIREEQADLANRGLDHFFHFFPATDSMASAIRGVDAVVMPSKWEACPLLPMEVMVSGRPLIASNCIGMNEVVADSPALVFDVGCLDGLLQQLEKFESRQLEILTEFDEYRNKAAERFCVSVTSCKLNQVFNRMFKNRGDLV